MLTILWTIIVAIIGTPVVTVMVMRWVLGAAAALMVFTALFYITTP